MNFEDWTFIVNVEDVTFDSDEHESRLKAELFNLTKQIVNGAGYMPSPGMLFGLHEGSDVVLDSVSFYPHKEICFWFKDQ